MNPKTRLEKLAALVRYYIIACTNEAGSGHPTSSLSAADLMTALFFGGFYRYFPRDPGHPNNDRLVFSKGHASPLLYALWTAAGQIGEEELLTYRRFGSVLEGHPTPRLRFVDAASGSLGQGLSIGVGLALNAKLLDKLGYRTFVLLGDGEMAEGSQWEALQVAAHYGLDNLVGILDVNRLGQSAPTMYGHDLDAYRRRVEAFGWQAVVVEDGHDMDAVSTAYEKALDGSPKPKMIVARTIKGKGVPSVEDREGFHGKVLGPEKLAEALENFGPVERKLRGEIAAPQDVRPRLHARRAAPAPSAPPYAPGQEVATRQAYGDALTRLYELRPDIVALDGDVGNSTGAEAFKKAHPDRYFEMYIAEQDMVGAALGLSTRGKVPFVATFAAFFSRAYDQIRMCQYSRADIKLCGSHAGASIGQDGPSQMGLEDIALFRNILGCAVLYPADAVSMEKLVFEAARRRGLVYLRSTREKTPVLYRPEEAFPIGGHKILRQSDGDVVAVVAAGVTVFEALKAQEALEKEGVSVRVIDQYSIQPIDAAALREDLGRVKGVVTVEDHHVTGGLGEAVHSALSGSGLPVSRLGVTRVPRSGTAAELLDFEDIGAEAISRAARALASDRKLGRPAGLKTRIFLDGGDPRQTRELLRLLGFLDGQTTNPTLISKNPEVRERLARGAGYTEDELLELYRDIVGEISELIPEGSVSVEVYADASTRAGEMLRMGRRMYSWIPNAHVKFPCTEQGLEAAAGAVSEGLRVNMTLCFMQRQAAAVYAATEGARRGDVFVSPFIGRLDDRGVDGMDVVADILKMYLGGDGHVQVLTASVRCVDHLLRAIQLGSDVVTAPFVVLQEWARRGLPLPDRSYQYPRPKPLEPVPYETLRLGRAWREFDLRHELTAKGQEQFAADWNALIARRPAQR